MNGASEKALNLAAHGGIDWSRGIRIPNAELEARKSGGPVEHQ